MNIIQRIKNHFELKCALKSSANYISYLRRKGLSIGTNCYFHATESITVDISRSYLVAIWNNCRCLNIFNLLTHDSTTKDFGNIYYEFLLSSRKVFIRNSVFFCEKKHCLEENDWR